MKKLAVGILILTVVFITCLNQACCTSEEVITYDIIGPPSWTITFSNAGDFPQTWEGIFTGDTNGGTADAGFCMGCGNGTYTRSANQITIILNWPIPEVPTFTLTGAITSNNDMGGNWVDSDGSSGTWLAER